MVSENHEQNNMGRMNTAEFINTLTMRMGQLAEQVETGIAVSRDMAVALQRIQDAMLTKDTYVQDKMEVEKRLTTIEHEIASVKGQPKMVSEYVRTLVPILAILGALVLGSLGLNLTTLIFLLNHIGVH